ncbi:uncharacterized protein [Euwallacea fornicatus]|uniref:uncharacterized protein n=1 Tax=Euwallacea fornicatus TaxID=995702 RepID=UPI00338E44CB
MAATAEITLFSLVLLICRLSCEPVGYNYGPPPKGQTEVEVIKVEVYEVPWIGNQPQSSYGPPGAISPPEETTTAISVTTSASPFDNSTLSSANSTQNERLESANEDLVKGQYYIYHPTGQLQKVTYLTRSDDKKMEFSARLQYRDIEPVKGPIYTYDPRTYVFSQLD